MGMFKHFRKNILSAVTLFSLPFLLLGIANPALAFQLTLQFCGEFLDAVNPGDGVLSSTVTLEINNDGTINTSAGNNGILDADISTSVNNVVVNYTEDMLSSFQSGVSENSETPLPYTFDGGLSDYWIFDDGNDNLFSFVLPNSVNLLEVQEINTMDLVDCRNTGSCFTDVDIIRRVPEPSVVLASMAFIGLMNMVRDRKKK